jgi:C-terminal processing protease CtpA/Prc
MSGWPGRLGAQIADMTEDLRKYFGAPADAGVLVTHVDADQPAGKAGLRVGDVITEVAGTKVEDPSDVIEAVADKDAGAQVKIVVVRDKRTATLTATLDKKPHDAFEVMKLGKLGKLNKMELPHEVFAWSEGGDVEKLRKQLELLEKRLEKLESQKK